jgi:hypothetical protein
LSLALLALLACFPLPLPSPLPGDLFAGKVLAAGSASYRDALIAGVPHVKQRPDFCGEACVEMALRRLGHAVSQDQVFSLTGVDPVLGRGAVTREMATALRRLGFDPGGVWSWIAASGPERRRGLERHFAALHADLLAGIPSILCTHFDESPGTTEHFRLVIGYDPKRDEVIYHDPALDGGASLRMKRARLYKLWPLHYKPKHDLLIRMPLRPTGKLALPAKPVARFAAADYAQRVMRLRQKLKKLEGAFTIVVEPPFVVAGDGGAAAVRRRARDVVRWSVALLKKDFFEKDPKGVIDIFLFKDRASYLKNTLRLLGETPTTPYGFYSERAGALIMNIATGGGTLVHEIVHPFMEANLPDPPAWMNEGMGSLFEACGERDGHIVGFLNWRLPGLQRAIRAGKLPGFARLLAMSDRQFYQEDVGDNYAQARYLMYHLQEKGLLRDFYRAYRKNRKQDPSGLQTLKAILKIKDLDAFQREWEREVLKLRWQG